MTDYSVQDIEDIILESGLKFPDLFNSFVEKNSRLIQLSENNHNRYCELYEEVFSVSSTTKEKGNKLEDLIVFLFKNAFPIIFEVKRNCRTSTNELDLLISWTQQAKSSGILKELCGLGNAFLCECKNYKGKVDVTYIGKFMSLLCCSDTKLGVMVAWDGVTGNGWKAGMGLIKKIALSEKRYILVITKEDLESIYLKKDNLFNILMKKYAALKQDIEYASFIKRHELEDRWDK
ncbi:hypothetical protein [Butyrivibrio sp. M55]|uniref:hypothetical protein n=1 Tax=Butyrivibrio sp. M55 TaxID=1855323 RepID=UPI0008F4198B|nr:hypothetical protein [Butyrivibrio sp. M55]SFU95733.1 hypothetical protein SAMN05216540_1284 [Butyrivibrio sp. M55]